MANSHRRRRRRLCVRDLECRITPTIYTVTSIADSGAGSLRQAAINANASAGADTIVFDTTLFSSAQSIALSSGQIAITENVEITGPGSALLTVKGGATASPTDRIFRIDDNLPGKSLTVTISGISVADGNLSSGDGAGMTIGNESVTLDDVVFTNNRTAGSGGAVALASGSRLTASASRWQVNFASVSGGGLYLPSSSQVAPVVKLTNCQFVDNSAKQYGGAVYLYAWADTTVNRCIFSGNSAAVAYGGVASGGGLRSISDSTFVGNSAPSGGGLALGGMSATVTNCTFSGNQATDPNGQGGGLLLLIGCGSSTVRNSTFTLNHSAGTGGGVHFGGSNAASFSFVGCVVAGNTSGQGSSPDIRDSDWADMNRNVIGVAGGGDSGVYGIGNLTGTAAKPLDARLAPLADNGGPTPTHRLLPGSPAFNAGNNAGNVPHDQRGPGFPRVLEGATDAGALELLRTWPVTTAKFSTITTAGATQHSVVVSITDDVGVDVTTLGDGDIQISGPGFAAPVPAVFSGWSGSPQSLSATYQFTPPGGAWDPADNGSYAVQVMGNAIFDLDSLPQPAPAVDLGSIKVFVPSVLVVDSPADLDDGDYSPGNLTLREAVTLSNKTGTADTITFASAVGVIALSKGELVLTDSATVIGPGAGLLTVSGNAAVAAPNNRVFNVSSPSLSLHVSALTLTGGNLSGFEAGGAIRGGSTVTLDGVVLRANRAFSGGAVAEAATLNLNGCTLENNSAVYGGAIDINMGALNDCVFRDNKGADGGGAVRFKDTLSATGCRFENNQAYVGGAIYSRSFTASDLLLSRTILAGNVATTGDGGAIYAVAVTTITITDCTLAGNQAAGSGGAAFLQERDYWNDVVRLTNCTISANESGKSGGGLYDFGFDIVLNNSTVTQNRTLAAGGKGGGFFLLKNGVSEIKASLSSSIVAGNLSASAPDFQFSPAGTVDGENALIGVADVGNITLGGSTIQTGTLAVPLDPRLGPLGNNGGPTPTHGLLPGSPAVNAGNNSEGLAHDQRGPGFARVVGGAADIGAFECQSLPAIQGQTVVINSGAAQRSRVTSVRIDFDQLVGLPPNPPDAFELRRQSDGQLVDLSAAVVSDTSTHITFSFQGSLSESGSLSDGRYSLTVFADLVFGALGKLDGDGDGTAGGNFVLVGDPAAAAPGGRLIRLFGDADGDGDVDAVDFGAFRVAFGGSNNTAMDFDSDGDVDAMDFSRFRQRFGQTV